LLIADTRHIILICCHAMRRDSYFELLFRYFSIDADAILRLSRHTCFAIYHIAFHITPPLITAIAIHLCRHFHLFLPLDTLRWCRFAIISLFTFSPLFRATPLLAITLRYHYFDAILFFFERCRRFYYFTLRYAPHMPSPPLRHFEYFDYCRYCHYYAHAHFRAIDAATFEAILRHCYHFHYAAILRHFIMPWCHYLRQRFIISPLLLHITSFHDATPCHYTPMIFSPLSYYSLLPRITPLHCLAPFHFHYYCHIIHISPITPHYYLVAITPHYLFRHYYAFITLFFDASDYFHILYFMPLLRRLRLFDYACEHITAITLIPYAIFAPSPMPRYYDCHY